LAKKKAVSAAQGPDGQKVAPSPKEKRQPDEVLTITTSNGDRQIEVFHEPVSPGIGESAEFHKKDLAEYGANVGHRCGHGCNYCSTPAMYWRYVANERVGRKPGAPGYAVVDPNAAQVIARRAREIPLKKRGRVQLCTVVDAFSPEAQRYNIGPESVKALLAVPGWIIRILSKNAAVETVYDLCQKPENKDRVMVGISLTGTPEKEPMINVIEPCASSITDRMNAMRKAHGMGLKTYAMLCPLMPGIADSPEDIQQLIDFSQEIGAESIWAENVNARGDGLIQVVEELKKHGFHEQAKAVDAIRSKPKRSEYVLRLIRTLQTAVRKTYGNAGKLKFLLYPSNLTDEHKAELKKDDEGVIWLRDDDDQDDASGEGKQPTQNVATPADGTPSDAKATSSTASVQPHVTQVVASTTGLVTSTAASRRDRTGSPVTSQSAQDAAKAMLQNPDNIEETQADIAAMGVVGEESLSLLIYLLGTSRLLDHPLAAVIQGPSAAGKSYLAAKISKLFPDDAVVQAHRITPQALVDVPAEALVHRFVVGGERSRRRDPEATRTLRELLADGHTSVLRKGERIDVKGPIAFIESTTLEPDKIFGEDLNRCLLLNVDAGAGQTKRIQTQMAQRVKHPVKADLTPVIEKHQAAQMMLKRCDVFIPYADKLAELYPSNVVETRRSFRHLLSLIQAIALLRQYQRLADPQDGMPLSADLDDYELARYLLARPKNSGLSRKVTEAYQMLPKLGPQFSAKDVATAMKRDEADTRDAIRQLKSRNLIRETIPAKGRRAALYQLVASTDDGLDLPMPELLSTPENSTAGGSLQRTFRYRLMADGNLAGRGYEIVLSPTLAGAQPSAHPEKPNGRETGKPAGDDVP